MEVAQSKPPQIDIGFLMRKLPLHVEAYVSLLNASVNGHADSELAQLGKEVVTTITKRDPSKPDLPHFLTELAPIRNALILAAHSSPHALLPDLMNQLKEAGIEDKLPKLPTLRFTDSIGQVLSKISLDGAVVTGIIPEITLGFGAKKIEKVSIHFDQNPRRLVSFYNQETGRLALVDETPNLPGWCVMTMTIADDRGYSTEAILPISLGPLTEVAA